MFKKILKKIASVLDESSLPYMVIGGQAVLLYGEPRLTRDMEDARSILIKNPDYNKDYSIKWLHKFDDALRQDKFLDAFLIRCN